MRAGDQLSKSFTYAWIPFSGIPTNIDWTELSTTEQESNHILITGDEQLSARIISPKTLAVIVVNSSEIYELDEKVVSECKQSTIPTIAVTNSDGNHLMALLSSRTKVEIQIETIPIEGEGEGDADCEKLKLGKLDMKMC